MLISSYLNSEIRFNQQKSQRIPIIVQEIKNFCGKDSLITIRGDGNCLIRALFTYMEHNTPRIYQNNIVDILLMANKDIELSHADDPHTLLCEIVRDLVVKKWDLKGEHSHHMNENAIDGLAIEMVMRILGIDRLNIYQAYNGSDRQEGWRIITPSKKGFQNDNITAFIFTMNGTHYHTIC